VVVQLFGEEELGEERILERPARERSDNGRGGMCVCVCVCVCVCACACVYAVCSLDAAMRRVMAGDGDDDG